MVASAVGVVAILLVYLASILTPSSSTNPFDLQEDIVYDTPDRYEMYEAKGNEDENLADILDNRLTVSNIKEILREVARRRIQKKACDTNLQYGCNTKEYLAAIEEQKHLKSALAPGRRKRDFSKTTIHRF